MNTIEIASENCIVATLLALANKSSELCEHSVHVAMTATDIAALMRGNGYGARLLDERDTFIAGLIHDVGKLFIDDDILTKKGLLDSRERDIIRKHAQLGYGLVSNIAQLEHLAPYTLQHHERPAGKGYPNGLDTEDIMIMSRILNIADRFTGMLVDRPYRNAIPTEDIIPTLEADIVDFFGGHAPDIIDTLLSTDKSRLEDATGHYLMDTGIFH